MIPTPSSDGAFNPFGQLDLDLSDTELRETAYEIFVGVCGIPGGGKPLSYVSPSGKIQSTLGPSLQQSLTCTSNSKVKMSLGINSPTKRKGSGSVPVMPMAKGYRHPTVGELMRFQLKISEQIDSRVRPALQKIASCLHGRRIESIVLPIELLLELKSSDFQTHQEYDEWQRRNMKILEVGLLLHPKIPIDENDTYVQQLFEIIHGAYECPMVTGEHSEEVKTLHVVAKQLASRTFYSDDADTSHWADGVPFNLRLYQVLLEALFDVDDPTLMIEEVDGMLEFIKRTWDILGLDQRFHNLCFLWVLFNRYVSTGQGENDLPFACFNLLLEVKTDAYSGFDSEYFKILKSTLTLILNWTEKGLLSYHEFFYRDNIDLMHIVLSIGLLAAELVVEECPCDDGTSKTVNLARTKVDSYIRSSMQKAFNQGMEKLRVSKKSAKRHQTYVNQLPALCVMAQDMTDLAFTEKEIYSPVLVKWHPLAVGVAVATLHSCFGQEVKSFISRINDLTPDVIQVLIAADKLENCLVQMAVEDSFNSEDGGKSVIQEMIPYEVEAVIADLVKSWIQTRVDRLAEWVDRNLQKEVWNPTINKGLFAPSAVEALRTIGDTLEAFFLLPIPLHADLIPDLMAGLDKSLQSYIFKAKGSGSRSSFLPKLPSLTQCTKNDEVENRKPTTEGDDSYSIPQLCVRINTIQYIRKEVDGLEKRVMTQLRSTGSSHDNGIINGCSISFKQCLAACVDVTRQLSELTAYKVVFHELNNVFWERLYVDEASSSRIEPFLQELEQILEKITQVIQDDMVRTMVMTDIMKASYDGFLLVLLAGGPCRRFTPQDCSIIQEDFNLLVDLFWSHGDRLPTDLITQHSATVEGILPLFATETESLIKQFKTLAVDENESLTPGPGPGLPQWDRNQPNTILSVLCHRHDKVASAFLKTKIDLPKKL